SFVFYFFQAEDGIRDFHVTGVQTCALPILGDIALPVPQLAAFVVAVIVAFGTRYLMEKTDFGRAVRALSQDRDVARAFGIDPHRVAMRLAGLAAAFAAIAGVFIEIGRASCRERGRVRGRGG